MKTKIFLTILVLGLLTACGAQPTEAPVSQPTPQAAAPTETVVAAPAATATTQPTDVPASPTAEQAATVSFANDVLPILQSRCENCHGGNKTEKGLDVLSYDKLMQGSEKGVVVVAGDADHSKLVELVVNQKMPKRGPKLTPPQIQLIVDWINQGALNN